MFLSCWKRRPCDKRMKNKKANYNSKNTRSFTQSRASSKMSRKIRKLHKWPVAITNLSVVCTPCWVLFNFLSTFHRLPHMNYDFIRLKPHSSTSQPRILMSVFLCVYLTDNNHRWCHRRRRRCHQQQQAESTHSQMLIYLLLWIFQSQFVPVNIIWCTKNAERTYGGAWKDFQMNFPVAWLPNFLFFLFVPIFRHVLRRILENDRLLCVC